MIATVIISTLPVFSFPRFVSLRLSIRSLNELISNRRGVVCFRVNCGLQYLQSQQIVLSRSGAAYAVIGLPVCPQLRQQRHALENPTAALAVQFHALRIL